MRLVFLGTPDFACPSLAALADAGHDIRLVVSQPDRARGRGRRSLPTPVRALAQDLGLSETTLQRGQRKALYERILGLDAELAVVVAFGHIIREPLLNGLERGCVNVHASLLPRWRGPAPIHRAIVAGDAAAGVSIMRLEAGVDTGPVYLSASTSIGPDETAGELHDRLAQLGAEQLRVALDRIEEGLRPTAQPDIGVTHAPLLSKEEGTVDFDRPLRQVHDRIRGLSPWPGIAVRHGDGLLKLAGSRALGHELPSGRAGELLAVEDDRLLVRCADGVLAIERVQAPGSRWMKPGDFRRGHALAIGDQLAPLAPVPTEFE